MKKARSLYTFVHPERCVYILGAESNGLPKTYMKNKLIVEIPKLKNCLNVSVAGSIVMYDRISKEALR